MKIFFSNCLVAAAAILISGCGSGPQAHQTIRPPDPPGTYKVPTTKAEKIAAIKKAHLSDDMKKAAIAKVNAGPGP